LLTLLRAAGQDHNELIAILAKIDPLTRTKIDRVFVPLPLLLPFALEKLPGSVRMTSSHFRRRRWMKIKEPFLKRDYFPSSSSYGLATGKDHTLTRRAIPAMAG
jgi:hypothetical protein